MEAFSKDQQGSFQTAPRLCSLNFSDDRTALVKLIGSDNQLRYVQLLRLDGEGDGIGGMLRVPNDGWTIMREVLVAKEKNHEDSMPKKSLDQTLQSYLEMEHGGGGEDKARAQSLFDPNAALLAVGINPVDEPPTDYTGAVGSFLEISLQSYLEGVQSQTPHSEGSKLHDAICAVDYMTGTNAAAATVRVGNAAQTLVFEDHLLLGRQKDEWRILSKTFSPQAWPIHDETK
jgi:hypothetical protein